MSRLNELRQEARSVVAVMDEVAKIPEREKRSLNTEEQARWDTAEARESEITREIQRIEAAEAANARYAQGQADERRSRGDGSSAALTSEQRAEQSRDYYNEVLRFGENGISAEAREYLESGQQLSARERQGVASEARAALTPAQSIGVAADGGYLAPTEFMTELIREVSDSVSIMDLCRVMQTSHGRPLTWPTMDDTGYTAQNVAELNPVAKRKIAIGQLSLGAHKISPGEIIVSNELLQDEIIDLAAEIMFEMNERISDRMNRIVINGTGTNEGQGVLVGAGKNVTGGASIQFQDFINLEAEIAPRYRKTASDKRSLAYLLHSKSLAAIKLLSLASDNEFFWQPSLRDGNPATLNGLQYRETDDMPEIGAGATPLLLGNFKHMRIRMVRQLSIKRLVEKYAEEDAVAFLGFMRADCKVFKPNAFAKLTLAA